jgi:thymidylate synthase (FAD)
VNELSARYSIVPDDYFLPGELRSQSTTRGQGGEEPYEDGEFLILKQKSSCDLAFHTYDEMIKKGVSRELARTHLPQSTFTEFYWKINLHNLLHFLELRIEDHAQKEIRDLAKQVYELIKPFCPMTCEAFEDFRLGSVTLSRLEVQAILNQNSKIPGKGENQEFQDKLKVIGISIKEEQV